MYSNVFEEKNLNIINNFILRQSLTSGSPVIKLILKAFKQ